MVEQTVVLTVTKKAVPMVAWRAGLLVAQLAVLMVDK